ncbi:MAG: SAVED domain-containing protein [Acidobacteriota bacterium]|nr:SAVED domain-containing protein [Acidobacteriota bacterium]
MVKTRSTASGKMADYEGYNDFEIELRSVADNRRDLPDGTGRSFEARVLTAPYGRAAAPFVPPFDAAQLMEVLNALERRVRAGSPKRDLAWESGPQQPPIDPADLGHKLFKALFSGEVERRFREELAAAQTEARLSGGRRGLRLRLTFDRAEDFALLATLPWELLRDDHDFLSLQPFTPIVRSFNKRTPPLPLATGPLRVLLVDSRPTDLQSLDIDQEMDAILAGLSRNPHIKVVHLPHPNVQNLRSTLEAEHCQILHFMGHGSFRPGSKEELSIAFESEDGTAEEVTGELLGIFLKDLPALRLVVLNACWGAAFPRRGGQDPFTGVAAALMLRGIPAVLAMQFPISDEAAIAFSDAFYARLVAGDSLCKAVTAGRLGIRAQESLEWATPTLFLADDDHLFDIPSVTVPRQARQAGQTTGSSRRLRRPTAAKPLLLAIRSFPEPFLGTTDTPDDLLDLTPYFDDRLIRRHSLWQGEVFPQLREFLLRHASTRRPLVFDFAAHSTLAFAAGYCLEAKSGLDITLLQRTQQGTQRWHAEAGPARQGPLWTEEVDSIRHPMSSDDAAMAVSITVQIAKHVALHLDREKLAVRRIIPVTLYPFPSSMGVADGLHALQLAQDLEARIRGRSPRELAAILHLFTAAPNALLFFLGQLGKGLGTVQLYEHHRENQQVGTYLPSLRLPFSGNLT